MYLPTQTFYTLRPLQHCIVTILLHLLGVLLAEKARGQQQWRFPRPVGCWLSVDLQERTLQNRATTPPLILFDYVTIFGAVNEHCLRSEAI